VALPTQAISLVLREIDTGSAIVLGCRETGGSGWLVWLCDAAGRRYYFSVFPQ